jgi:hypothetical protein
LKFEVKYPGQPPHEVEREGPIVTLGRDPGCDLVLNDERCSRRHAVVESTADGMVVRDAGSANGVFVNGRKIERSPLKPGDLLRIGEVVLEVLADEVPGTVIVGPDDLMGAPPSPPARPPGPDRLGTEPAAPRPPLRDSKPAVPAPRAVPPPAAPRAVRRGPPGRPLTVTLLASLWMLSAVLYGAGGIVALWLLRVGGMSAAIAIGSGGLLALVSVVMAYGLWTLRPWARVLQAIVSGLGLVFCPFTLASATVLIYVLRPGTRAAFGGAPAPATDEAGSETTFAITLAGTVLLGGALLAVAWLLMFLRG